MANSPIEQKLKSLRNLNSNQPELQKITIHKANKTSWINWNHIRNAYVLGKRIEEFDEDDEDPNWLLTTTSYQSLSGLNIIKPFGHKIS